MVRLSCPQCKKVTESATDNPDVAVYCPECGFVIKDIAANEGNGMPATAAVPSATPPQTNTDQWLYAKDKKKGGPVSQQELKRLIGAGQLAPGDMVLQAGTQKWVTIGSIPELVQANLTPVASRPAPVAPAPAAPPSTAVDRKEWHYVKDRQKTGPVSLKDVKELIAGGKLRPSDMVLKEGTQKWVQAMLVPEIAGPGPAPTPVAPGKPNAALTPAKPPEQKTATGAGQPSANNGWFYSKNGKKVGPIQATELIKLTSSGELGPADLVFKEGTQRWVAISSLPALCPANPPPAKASAQPPQASAPPTSSAPITAKATPPQAPPPPPKTPSPLPSESVAAEPKQQRPPSKPAAPVTKPTEPVADNGDEVEEMVARAAEVEPTKPAAPDEELSGDGELVFGAATSPLDEDSGKGKKKGAKKKAGSAKKTKATKALTGLIWGFTAFVILRTLLVVLLEPETVVYLWPVEWLIGIAVAYLGIRAKQKSAIVVGLSAPVAALCCMLVIVGMGLNKQTRVPVLLAFLMIQAVGVLLTVALRQMGVGKKKK